MKYSVKNRWKRIIKIIELRENMEIYCDVSRIVESHTHWFYYNTDVIVRNREETKWNWLSYLNK